LTHLSEAAFPAKEYFPDFPVKKTKNYYHTIYTSSSSNQRILMLSVSTKKPELV